MWSLGENREVATLPVDPLQASGRRIFYDAPGRRVLVLDGEHLLQTVDGGAPPPRTAEVYRWVPIRSDGSGDVALLRLTDGGAAREATPTPVLRRPDTLWNQPRRSSTAVTSTSGRSSTSSPGTGSSSWPAGRGSATVMPRSTPPVWLVRVSEREVNPHLADLRLCGQEADARNNGAGQKLDVVSEGGLEPPRPLKGTSTSS